MGSCSLLEDAEDRLNADQFDMAARRAAARARSEQIVQSDHLSKGSIDGFRYEAYRIRRRRERAFDEHERKANELLGVYSLMEPSVFDQADRIRELEDENLRLRDQLDRLHATAAPQSPPRGGRVSRRKQRQQRRAAIAWR